MNSRWVRFALEVIFIQAVLVASADAGKCGRSPVDLIFVLDESGSIWGPDFTKQLHFVQNLIDGFYIGPNGTHVGLETFGNDVRTIIQLREVMDPELLKRRVEAIVQRRGSTGTHLALKHLRGMFSGGYGRPEASKVAIVITDGESDIPQLTAIEAKLVHEEGIIVVAIGVGQSIKRSELDTIASQPDYVFTVNNYDDLSSLLDILAIKACPVEESTTPTTSRPSTLSRILHTTSWPEPAPATRTYDWTLVPTVIPPCRPVQPKSTEGCDASFVFNLYFGIPDHLSVLDTYLALQFIRDVTYFLQQTKSLIRPHLIPRICQTTFPTSSDESTDFANQIDFLASLDRRAEDVTRNDLQLQYVTKKEEEFRQKYPAKDEDFRSAIAIFIVDNRLANAERMIREIEHARRKGIQILPVGVGDYTDRNELWKMATTERDVMHLRSYDYLPTIRDALMQRVCLRGLVHSARNSFKRDFNEQF